MNRALATGDSNTRYISKPWRSVSLQYIEQLLAAGRYDLHFLATGYNLVSTEHVMGIFIAGGKGFLGGDDLFGFGDFEHRSFDKRGR